MRTAVGAFSIVQVSPAAVQVLRVGCVYRGDVSRCLSIISASCPSEAHFPHRRHTAWLFKTGSKNVLRHEALRSFSYILPHTTRFP